MASLSTLRLVSQIQFQSTKTLLGRRTLSISRQLRSQRVAANSNSGGAPRDSDQQPVVQQIAPQDLQEQHESYSEGEAEYITDAETPTTSGPEQEQIAVTAGPLGKVQVMLDRSPALRIASFAAAGFLGLTFLIALLRTGLKFTSPEAKRGRTINKNKLVVDEIRKYLPGNRAGLGGGTVGRLRLQTGYSPVEIFRKYLWFLLRERKFDQEAVDDLVALKNALGLSDEEAAEAVRERAQRIYNKYGNVMLETEGMTKSGIERKATTRALFSKLQYLLDYEPLMASEASEKVSLRDIFGATEQDVARLRIVSLHEVDLEAAAAMPSAEEPEEQQQE